MEMTTASLQPWLRVNATLVLIILALCLASFVWQYSKTANFYGSTKSLQQRSTSKDSVNSTIIFNSNKNNYVATNQFTITTTSSPYDDYNYSSALSSVDFVAQFGTGHRLSRLSLANFIAEHLGFGLRTFWGFCPRNSTNSTSTLQEVEIFSHLFGPQPLRDLTRINLTHRNILFVNKIYTGFHFLVRQQQDNNTTALPSTQNHNHSFLLQTNQTKTTTTMTTTCDCHSPPMQAKIKADIELYRNLRHRFRATPTRVQAIRDKYFDTLNVCLVIGLHVRAGNGEARHFAASRRYIDMNVTEWVSRVADHIRTLTRQWGRYGNETTTLPHRCRSLDSASSSSSTPASSAHNVLFIATDTPSMIHQFRAIFASDDKYNNTNGNDRIRVVELEQERKVTGSGVWFGDEHLHERGDKCLTTWEDSFCDMMLLSYADIVVASRLSSYTQTLPMSLAFAARQDQLMEHQASSSSFQSNQLPPAYCDMNRDASSMECFESLVDWCCNGATTPRGSGESIEVPNEDFFRVSYFNATTRVIPPGGCDPHRRRRMGCLPLEYNT